jgi:hypothetical protein
VKILGKVRSKGIKDNQKTSLEKEGTDKELKSYLLDSTNQQPIQRRSKSQEIMSDTMGIKMKEGTVQMEKSTHHRGKTSRTRIKNVDHYTDRISGVEKNEEGVFKR